MTRITEPNPASILARLRALGRTRYPNLPANAMLLLYAQQGLLARLDASPYAERFVLKGALSLFARFGQAARPTEDLDFASRGLPQTAEDVRAVLGEVCSLRFGDGLTFDAAAISVIPNQLGHAYPGVKAHVIARLGASRADLNIDVSFGNAITPAPVVWTFPPLLLEQGVPVPIYPLETVVTEKFAALVEIGEATTRMKDLYDLYVILTREALGARDTSLALHRSFAARGTPTAAVPLVLDEAFGHSEVLTRRWGQYLARTRFSAPPFEGVMALLRTFYRPLLMEGQDQGTWSPTAVYWQDASGE
jgi:predicted nucleotidyltransferase component of viral defense system